jgi:hypothetical protein
VSTQWQVLLKRISGFSAFTRVCQVLYWDDVDPAEDTAPEKIPLIKYAHVTFCNVERSFSAYKHILSVKRQTVTPENMEKILIVYCA